MADDTRPESYQDQFGLCGLSLQTYRTKYCVGPTKKRCTKAVCKVRGLILSLRVGTLWRCGDGLFFELPPLASDALLTTLHPLLENVLQTVNHFRNFLPRSSLFMDGKAQKSHGSRSELNSVFGLEKVDRWNPIRTSAIQSRSRPMRFLGFSNHEKAAPRQGISK
jgi:hypothetical protein